MISVSVVRVPLSTAHPRIIIDSPVSAEIFLPQMYKYFCWIEQHRIIGKIICNDLKEGSFMCSLDDYSQLNSLSKSKRNELFSACCCVQKHKRYIYTPTSIVSSQSLLTATSTLARLKKPPCLALQWVFYFPSPVVFKWDSNLSSVWRLVPQID